MDAEGSIYYFKTGIPPFRLVTLWANVRDRVVPDSNLVPYDIEKSIRDSEGSQRLILECALADAHAIDAGNDLVRATLAEAAGGQL